MNYVFLESKNKEKVLDLGRMNASIQI